MRVAPGRSRQLASALAVMGSLVLAGCGDGGAGGEAVAAAGGDTVVTVTDLAGREVELEAPVRRIVLGQARLFYMTALLDRGDPAARLVGWPDDLRTADPDAYDHYAAVYPDLAEVPEIGSVAKASFSPEAAIALDPDVFVLPLSAYRSAVELGAVDRLEKAGVPTVVVDFHDHPLENTVPSARLLGTIMGREPVAEAFVGFYETQVEMVRSRLAAPELPAEARPRTFLYRAAGLLECCATFGDSNLGELVEAAGGENLGAAMLPGAEGVLNPEAVLDADPDVIIATGANWKNQETKPADVGFVSLGYGAGPAAAEQLDGLTDQPGWSALSAVRTGQFYGVWHQFYTSPYNFVALVRFAKWLHPDRFADVDPDGIFRELHERFLPVPYRGAFWTQLP